MANFSLDTRQFKNFRRNLIGLYGRKRVNRWSRQAFGGPTPKPLERSLEKATPRRTGRLRRSIGSQVIEDPLTKEPVLAVGGDRRRGGFVYYFLRGTRPRQTRAGHFRGRVADHKIETAAAVGFRSSARLYIDRFIKAWGGGVQRLRRLVRRG